MKNKINLSKGLMINKESLTRLQESQMAKLMAGAGSFVPSSSGNACSCAKKSC